MKFCSLIVRHHWIFTAVTVMFPLISVNYAIPNSNTRRFRQPSRYKMENSRGMKHLQHPRTSEAVVKEIMHDPEFSMGESSQAGQLKKPDPRNQKKSINYKPENRFHSELVAHLSEKDEFNLESSEYARNSRLENLKERHHDQLLEHLDKKTNQNINNELLSHLQSDDSNNRQKKLIGNLDPTLSLDPRHDRELLRHLQEFRVSDPHQDLTSHIDSSGKSPPASAVYQREFLPYLNPDHQMERNANSHEGAEFPQWIWDKTRKMFVKLDRSAEAHSQFENEREIRHSESNNVHQNGGNPSGQGAHGGHGGQGMHGDHGVQEGHGGNGGNGDHGSHGGNGGHGDHGSHVGHGGHGSHGGDGGHGGNGDHGSHGGNGGHGDHGSHVGHGGHGSHGGDGGHGGNGDHGSHGGHGGHGSHGGHGGSHEEGHGSGEHGHGYNPWHTEFWNGLGESKFYQKSFGINHRPRLFDPLTNIGKEKVLSMIGYSQFFVAEFLPWFASPDIANDLFQYEHLARAFVLSLRPHVLSPLIRNRLVGVIFEPTTFWERIEPEVLSPELWNALLEIESKPKAFQQEMNPCVLGPEIRTGLLRVDMNPRAFLQELSPWVLCPELRFALMEVNLSPEVFTDRSIPLTMSVLSPEEEFSLLLIDPFEEEEENEGEAMEEGRRRRKKRSTNNRRSINNRTVQKSLVDLIFDQTQNIAANSMVQKLVAQDNSLMTPKQIEHNRIMKRYYAEVYGKKCICFKMAGGLLKCAAWKTSNLNDCLLGFTAV